MDTDESLGLVAAVSIAVCGLCVVYAAWKQTNWPRRQGLKASSSDTDLTDMLENSIPSASATRRLTPPEDPTRESSEV